MATLAAAQDEPADAGETSDEDSGLLDAPRNGASIYVGGMYTDNFYYQTAPAAKVDGYGLIVRPQVTYLNQTTHFDIKALADGEYGTFDTDTADSYADGRGKLVLAWTPTVRNRFEADGGLQQGHDPFGTLRSETCTTPACFAARDRDLDRWNESTGGARYVFGAPGAIQNAEVGIHGVWKRYITNECTSVPAEPCTAGTQFLDYEATTSNYALFYNLAPKTAVLIDYVRTQVGIEHPFGPSDSRAGHIYQIRGGVRWLATAQTSGDVRLGARRRTFETGAKELNGFDWEAGIDWSPVQSAKFGLKTGRTEQQSYINTARVIDVEYGSVQWLQTWSSRTKSTLGFDFNRSHFFGSTRTDYNYIPTLGVDYRALSYLSLTMGAQYVDRQSNVAAREYSRFAANVGLRLGY